MVWSAPSFLFESFAGYLNCRALEWAGELSSNQRMGVWKFEELVRLSEQAAVLVLGY